MRRFFAVAGVPIAVLAMATLPLLVGARTLVLRDVLNTHLGLRASLAPALRAAEIPLIDPLRSGGQPLAGNPNALPFYPDNLLLLFGSPLWQLNVHFALHWLLAFAAALWLGRAWGLRNEGALGVATAYALSGFLFSQLNLYNGITEVALAPALWAALLELGRAETRKRATLGIGVVWALVLLGGDPPLGAVALAGGVVVALVRDGRRYPSFRLLAALACGTLLAAPQLVETLRVLGESYRGFWGYAEGRAGARHPATLLELFVPMIYGRPDLGTGWGNPLFGSFPPLYFSLYPGFAGLSLALAAGRFRRRESIAVAVLAGLGATLAFSGGTLIEVAVRGLSSTGFLRFPEKFFLLSALGLAIAVGTGTERLVHHEGWRPVARSAALLAVPLLALWLGFGLGGRSWERLTLALFSPALDSETYSAERLRWAGLSMLGLATLMLTLLLALGVRRRPRLVATLLLALHATAQWVLLQPLAVTDSASPYERRPRLLDRIPERAVLAHSGAPSFGEEGYFDRPTVDAGLPPVAAVERRAHEELLGFTGRRWGRRYELDIAPDGIDHFVVQAIARGMSNFSDPLKIRILAATGVDRLLMHRALVPETAGGARRVTEWPGLDRPLYVYEIPRPLPDAVVVGDVTFAPHLNAALEQVWSPRFDPLRAAVVAGTGEPRTGPAGEVRILAWKRERIELAVDSGTGGYLVLRRAYLPIWNARVDDRRVSPVIANLTRLAVELPPGEHQVKLWISRAPLRFAWAASLVGLIGLVGVVRIERGGEGPSRRDSAE